MPMNNNQSVAARLAKLPAVRSACTKLLVLYAEAKRSHPDLKAVCEGLEGNVAALAASATLKLEPQICVANDIACKSLDWLETTFPDVKAPTGLIIAAAQNKVHEIQDALKTATGGTAGCVQNSVTWLMGRMEQVGGRVDQLLVARANNVASVGLDSALTVSEAVMDTFLPPTEEEKAAAAAQLLERVDLATPRSSRERLVLLAARLYERINLVVVQTFTRSAVLVQSLKTLPWRIQELPQYMRHQFVSMLFFIVCIFNLSCSQSQRRQSNRDGNYVNADENSTYKRMIRDDPEAAASTLQVRHPKRLAFGSGCNG
ncbi:perilipin-2-like [Brachionichthys hirsutus]|uniref:perilipin-2-like n=1 Tax=Brachionichthys hirsutus TaxID=412623 RepID=UPI003604B24E